MYIIIDILTGHYYPYHPFFGVVPCPTTVFLFGLLLMTDRKVPKIITILPLCYSLIIGFLMVLFFQIWADIGMIAAGIISSILIYYRNSKEFTD
jgi:hypothetical protein